MWSTSTDILPHACTFFSISLAFPTEFKCQHFWIQTFTFPLSLNCSLLHFAVLFSWTCCCNPAAFLHDKETFGVDLFKRYGQRERKEFIRLINFTNPIFTDWTDLKMYSEHIKPKQPWNVLKFLNNGMSVCSMKKKKYFATGLLTFYATVFVE